MTTLTGRAAFLSLLRDEGVDHFFGNPGTTELPIMEALGGFPEIKYVLALQESIVVAMADGYARASGKLGACNVHVAPGLGNAMGALYNAKWWGVPILITAGQQEQGHGLMEPLLYDPLPPIAQPLVKWATEVTRVEDLPRIVRRAAKVALAPPTGPVFISLPGDILDASADLDLGRATRVDADTRPNDAALARLADRLLAAKNPVLIAGHDLAVRDALAEAAELAELLGAAVYQQSCPYGSHFLSEHATFQGGLSRNQPQVRETLAPYDLLVSLGGDALRMSVYSPVDALPAGMPIVHISERDWDLGKNYPTEIAIKAGVKATLAALNALLRTRMSAEQRALAAARLAALTRGNWSAKRAKAAEELARVAQAKPIDPRVLMLRIAEAVPRDVVMVDEGISSTPALHTFHPMRDAQSHFGLGSGGIGWGIAAAGGVSLALPHRPVVAIIGDGSSMYSIQALWTAAHLQLDVTYVICNNRSYRILKDRLVSLRRTEKFIGMDFHEPQIDFVAMAQAMGVPARRVTDPADIGPALRAAIAEKGPHLLDVAIAEGFGH